MPRHVLTNAQLWIGDGTAIADGHVVLANGRIEMVGDGPYEGDLPRTNLEGAALSPGMIDLMALGGFGKSILRDKPLDIAREYLRLGVTSVQFCTGTLPWPAMQQIDRNIKEAMAYKGGDAATTLGFYLEGPFQHPDLTGASLRENSLPPTPENVKRVLTEFGQTLTMINVSPGVDGDADAVKQFVAAGKIVSMAHSNAPADRVMRCVEAGTSVLGHVFDNNSGLIGDSGVQQPTIEHVALTDERVRFIHMILDGQHVHPVLVRLVERCRGFQSICVVTDAVPLAGAPDGNYTWDDGRLFYKKNGVGRTDKHHLTGSGLLLPDMLRNFMKFTGLTPEKAIRTVTLNPASSLGLAHRIGQLAPGRAADLVAWDDQMKVQRVWRQGEEIDNVSNFAEIEVA